jgi:tetratricopeptide (TPR) repeat protein
MKIFVSYGHEAANKPLVDRVRQDLTAAGHELWFDTAEIKSGQDWRRAIVDGLLTTERVVAFLSAHAVRAGGVCLDELAIALQHKAGAITTILIEPEAEVQAPVTIAHIQWLDMSDWKTHGQPGDPAWEAWYAPKRSTLLDQLAHGDAAAMDGEIATLRGILKPVSETADIGALLDDFMHRPWLNARLESWRTARDERIFLLTGDPGSGKSAFCADAAHSGRANVVSLNLCSFKNEDRRDARRVIRTLAFQIASRLPDYRRFQLAALTREDDVKAELARKTPAALFDWLIAEPAKGIDGGRRHAPFLIVVDGLDETIRDGRCELAELLAERAPGLPAWLRLMATGRVVGPVERAFAGFPSCTIDRESPDTVADIRNYVAAWMAETPELSDAQRAATTTAIVAAADGNFLYVRKLREAVVLKKINLDAPQTLPHGLYGLYERWFYRQFPDRAAYERDYLPLIEIVVAASSPAPEWVIDKIFGWKAREKAKRLAALEGLFDRRPEGVAPFHKSIRDWLLDDKACGEHFLADRAEGERRLFDALWSRLCEIAPDGDAAPPDAFLISELPLQAARQSDAELRAVLEPLPPAAIFARIAQIAETRAAAFQWRSALDWWGLLSRLAGLTAALDWAGYALEQSGDIYITTGDTELAASSYNSSLTARVTLAAGDLGNTDWQRDLSVSYSKVGDVQVGQGNLADALKSYQSSLAILEHLAASDPGNAGWQRDLSVSFINLGDVQVGQGNLADALKSYQSSLAIRERLAAGDPGNAGWQRDLSVSYEKIGDVQVGQGNLADALKSYQSSFVIAERLAAGDPSNAVWRRDLSVSYEKIGNVQVGQGNLADALKSYQSSLAIRERLAAGDPGNAGWRRDLSVSYEKIGDVQVGQGNLADALKSYQSSLAIRERLAAGDPGNAGWQRDLSVSYASLAAVYFQEHRTQDARTVLNLGRAISARLVAQFPGWARWKQDLAWFDQQLKNLP